MMNDDGKFLQGFFGSTRDYVINDEWLTINDE